MSLYLILGAVELLCVYIFLNCVTYARADTAKTNFYEFSFFFFWDRNIHIQNGKPNLKHERHEVEAPIVISLCFMLKKNT